MLDTSLFIVMLYIVYTKNMYIQSIYMCSSALRLHISYLHVSCLRPCPDWESLGIWDYSSPYYQRNQACPKFSQCRQGRLFLWSWSSNLKELQHENHEAKWSSSSYENKQPTGGGSQYSPVFPEMREPRISLPQTLTSKRTTRGMMDKTTGQGASGQVPLFSLMWASQPLGGFTNWWNLYFESPHSLAWSKLKALLFPICHLFEKDGMICLLVMKLDRTALGTF